MKLPAVSLALVACLAIVASAFAAAPVLDPIPNLVISEGCDWNQTVTGSDPDGDPLTFSKTAGPTYMAVTTTSPTTGNIHLTPGFSDGGFIGATVTASDGTSSDSKSFTITVTSADRPPV